MKAPLCFTKFSPFVLGLIIFSIGNYYSVYQDYLERLSITDEVFTFERLMFYFQGSVLALMITNVLYYLFLEGMFLLSFFIPKNFLKRIVIGGLAGRFAYAPLTTGITHPNSSDSVSNTLLIGTIFGALAMVVVLLYERYANSHVEEAR